MTYRNAEAGLHRWKTKPYKQGDTDNTTISVVGDVRDSIQDRI